MRRGLLVLLGATIFAAEIGCNAIWGNEQRYLTPDGAAAGGPNEETIPDGGDSGTIGGEQDGAVDSSSETGTGCTPQCSSPKPLCYNGVCVECLTGSGECRGNTPSRCVNSTWEDQAPCTGATPVCNNGVCAPAKLTGELATVGTGVLGAGNARLVEHGLEYTPTTCGMLSGKQVCVTGGVRP